MSTYSVVNLIIIVGVIMVPITVVMTILGHLRNLKADKRESLELSSAMQSSMFNLMMAMLMRSPQPLNHQPQSQSSHINNQSQQPSEMGFEDWNQNFYGQQDLYQTPQLANKRASQQQYDQQQNYNLHNSQTIKSNGFVVGLLSGVVVFLGLAVIAMLAIRF